jgi:glycosyltransferase involved in cell wall biosynthesis
MGLPFGIPIVATGVGSIPEVVVDGRHGKIVPSGDIEGFAEAVRVLLADQPRLKRMSDYCCESARRLDFRNLSHDFVKLYSTAIFRRRSSHERQCVNHA